MSYAQGNAYQAWIRLCKPRTSSFYLISALLGMLLFVGRPIQPWPLLSIILVYVVAAGVYVLNDVYDIDIDRISAPDRPLPSGIVGIGKAKFVATCLLLAGPLLAIPIDIEAAILLGVFAVIGVAYSVPPIRLRKFFLAPSILIGIGNALGFLIGVTLSKGSSVTGQVLMGALLLIAFHTGPSMTKDLSDVEGHRKSGVVSLPVVLGLERAARITAIVALSSFVFAFLFLLLFDLKPFTYVGMAVCFVLVTLALRRLLSNVNDQDNVIRSFQLFTLGGLGSVIIMIVGALVG